jgi:hypothetical protein
VIETFLHSEEKFNFEARSDFLNELFLKQKRKQ